MTYTEMVRTRIRDEQVSANGLRDELWEDCKYPALIQPEYPSCPSYENGIPYLLSGKEYSWALIHAWIADHKKRFEEEWWNHSSLFRMPTYMALSVEQQALFDAHSADWPTLLVRHQMYHTLSGSYYPDLPSFLTGE